MDNTMNPSLLALMLALDDLPAALTEAESKSLAAVGEQLAANPDAWETHILPRLQQVLAANPDLQTGFATYKTAVEQLAAQQPEQLTSTLAQVTAQLVGIAPVPVGLVPKGYFPGPVDASEASEEINNIAVRVLLTPKPEETVKKVGAFQGLKSIVRQSSG
jgi:hypothetical protein